MSRLIWSHVTPLTSTFKAIHCCTCEWMLLRYLAVVVFQSNALSTLGMGKYVGCLHSSSPPPILSSLQLKPQCHWDFKNCRKCSGNFVCSHVTSPQVFEGMCMRKTSVKTKFKLERLLSTSFFPPLAFKRYKINIFPSMQGWGRTISFMPVGWFVRLLLYQTKRRMTLAVVLWWWKYFVLCRSYWTIRWNVWTNKLKPVCHFLVSSILFQLIVLTWRTTRAKIALLVLLPVMSRRVEHDFSPSLRRINIVLLSVSASEFLMNTFRSLNIMLLSQFTVFTRICITHSLSTTCKRN